MEDLISSKGKEREGHGEAVKGLQEIVWQCSDVAHKNRPTMDVVFTLFNKI